MGAPWAQEEQYYHLWPAGNGGWWGSDWIPFSWPWHPNLRWWHTGKIFRVGQPSSGKKRPIVIKFGDIGKKNAILLRAKNLKGKTKWSGVVITHDLTKMECHEEKAREIQLHQEVDEKNKKLSITERQMRFWKVVGGRGERHIVLFTVFSSC